MSGRPLAVGLLAHAWFPDRGGVESHTRDLARELHHRGHRVLALALDTSGTREPFSVEDRVQDGVPLRRMAYAYHDHRALADLVRHRRAEEVALAWAREHDLDLVHVHHATGWGLGILGALEEAGFPVVMTLHDYWPLCPRGQMLRVDGAVCAVAEPSACTPCLAATWPALLPSRGGEARDASGAALPHDEAGDAAAVTARTAFALEALGRARRLFTPSEAARAVYVRAGIPAQRIEVCENGIEVRGLADEVARLRAEAPPREGLRLACLGTVLPSKGALELARAFQDADVPGLTLEIHGALPAYHGDRSYVEALARLAEGDARITLHGPYDLVDLPRLLAGVDGVAAPSRWCEVFGLTVREARAAGLCVLVSDAGDLPAVTGGGAGGLVVPAGDHGAWVAALRRFATDAEARARWSAPGAGPRTAADMAAQLERAYRRVVRAARRPWWKLW